MPSKTISDDWQRVSELLELQGTPYLIEGFIAAQTNGLVFDYPSGTPPDGNGVPVAASGGAGIGPAVSIENAWDLRELWVKNETAGSNAVLVVSGVFRRG